MMILISSGLLSILRKEIDSEEFAANQIAISVSSERINKMKYFDLSSQKLDLETFDLNILSIQQKLEKLCKKS